MAREHFAGVLRRVRLGGAEAAVPDGRLLDRFLASRDEAAFELLVWRYQRMVLGVCRRVLRHPQDAEDAFQATFLLLARKARSIAKHGSVAAWLYRVAYRVSLDAKARRSRGSETERVDDSPAVEARPDPRDDPAWREVERIIDDEVMRLPEPHRTVVVLHYFQGKTYEEVAAIVGCPSGTASARLARAREALRGRLAGRGVSVPAGLFAAMLTREAASAAPAALVAAVTTGARFLAAAGELPAGAVSAAVAALTERGMRAMFWGKVKVAIGLLVVAGVLGTGAGLACVAPHAGAQPADPGVPPAADGKAVAGLERPPAPRPEEVQGKGEAARKELKSIQGWWTYDLAELKHEGGKETLSEVGERKTRVQIEGDQFRFRRAGDGPWDWEATIALDPTDHPSRPSRITLTRTIKADGKEKAVVDSGIYKLTTDFTYLEIHFGLDGKPAPKDFLEYKKPVRGNDGRVWTLKRATAPPRDTFPFAAPKRPLLPANAWPLTLGREQARRIVKDALEGRETVIIPSDELVYYGGGITAYPRDAFNTTITINWRMIREKLDSVPEADPLDFAKGVANPERQPTGVQPAAVALTPGEAVKSFTQVPKKPVTVEFGVGSAGTPGGLARVGDDPTPPITAEWDSRLADGGKFSVLLTAKAVRGLKEVGIDLPAARPAGLLDTQRLDALCKHLKGKRVRVTGLIRASRLEERNPDYFLVVDDPAGFRVYK